jgi:dipeptidyl aminopeptidase/acylaminoacyl peptidase
MSIYLVIGIIFLVLLLISAAGYLLVLGPLVILQPTRRSKEWYKRFTTLLEPKDAHLPQEDVLITTHDGLKLKGWFVPHPRARATVIFLHGVGDCKTTGVALARMLFNHSFNVFLYDSRRHGESEGNYCTYGYYEKQDVITVIDWLQLRTDVNIGKIGIFGTSMGAAVAIQAASKDSRIAVIVAEAGFTDLRTIIVDYQKRLTKLPWHFLRNVAMIRSQKFAKFKAYDVSPLRDIRKVNVPILFIHGTGDRYIKADYSEELYKNANQPKDILLIEGATHINQWEVGGTIYENKVIGFLEEYIV